MSLLGRDTEGIKPGTLAEIAETGKVRKTTSCLRGGLGPVAFEDSDAAKRLDDLRARIAAAAEY